MALVCTVVSGVLVTGVVLITVFILRLFGILRHGCEYKPGQKGSVSVLVVAGSGKNQSHAFYVIKCGVYKLCICVLHSLVWCIWAYYIFKAYNQTVEFERSHSIPQNIYIIYNYY